jgi:hypothetical protein
MDTDLPPLSDYDEDAEAWILEVDYFYLRALKECRAKKDRAGREKLLENLRDAVEQAVKLGVIKHWAVRLLARDATDPKERLHYYSIAYKNRMADPLTEWGFDEQAGVMIEAAGYLREMGLIHEALDDAAQAADCFTRALAHLQQGADLFETHCLDEDPDNSEGETFPLRPRLVTELERVRKRMGERTG